VTGALDFLQPRPARRTRRIRHMRCWKFSGKGGCGIVFRAFDDRFASGVVAVKVMAPQIATLSDRAPKSVRARRAVSSAAVRNETKPWCRYTGRGNSVPLQW